MAEFLLLALLAGGGISLLPGPLGVFLVWRQMAFFGDTLAHSALLGVALGVLLQWNLTVTLLGVVVMVALLLSLQHRYRLSSDTLLSILAQSQFALGLVLISLSEGVRVDLMGYLFGDILAVSRTDLLEIAVGVAVALPLLYRLWRPLLAVTVHEELAQVEGIPTTPVKIAYALLLALTVALAIKVVGILLITALLIIPAAAARYWSRTPEQMAALATLLSMVAVVLGLALSWQWDTPAGPSIVVSATLLFILSHAAPKKWR